MHGLTPESSGAAPRPVESVWRERAERLARGPARSASEQDARTVLVVTIGNERYGLALEDTAEVLPPRPVTPVPGAPPGVAGVINVHGEICPVIDLPCRLGGAAASGAGPASVVLIRQGEQVLGLLVDAAEHVLSIPASEIRGSAETQQDLPSHYLSGLTRDLLRLLRTASLFPAPFERIAS